MTWLQVAVSAPINNLLSYKFPSGDEYQVEQELLECHIGKRVLVHLGGRRVTGYVLGISPEEKVGYTVRKIVSFLDDYPLFHPNMVPIFNWIADYYQTPIGLVVKAALPSGLNVKSAKQIVLGENHLDEKVINNFSTEIFEWTKHLLLDGKLTVSATKRVIEDKKAQPLLKYLKSQSFIIVNDIVTHDQVKEKIETCFTFCEKFQTIFTNIDVISFSLDECQDEIKRSCDEPLKHIEVKTIYFLLKYLQESATQQAPQKEIAKQYPGSRKAFPLLIEKQIISIHKKRVFRNPFGGEYINRPIPEKLSDAQNVALASISLGLESASFKPFLLHGVTGSGKTEVYLRAAQKAVDLGRDVLVLVPEIALATQLESHFISRFGDLVVLQHSGLSVGEKYDQWFNALTGKAKIVIGARSAIFAPLKKCGLIIVDEEHDSAFKQDDSFRYNGRDLAVLRAKYNDSVVLLGSATPSIVSYHNASVGKYELLEMQDRVGVHSLPTVKLIDLKRKDTRKSKGIFRPGLEEELIKNFEDKQQSIVLLNRRGFSAVVLCRECGTQVQCKNCHVSLTMHKSINKLVCHYCNYSLGTDIVCEKCRSDKLIPVGFGTERVEEELTNLLPEARIARLDSDTTKNKINFLKILKEMHEGKIDVLVGTQMIAKGHDFPGVTLVGVVYADSGLHMPDFRAAEKTYQLISQVTGRAGRGDIAGRVIIQTMQPDHYAIRFAQRHQYHEFYEKEISIRKSPIYPPFARLITLHIDGKRLADVQYSSMEIVKRTKKWVAQNALENDAIKTLEVLGPAPSPLDRINDRYRWQVLIKSKRHDVLMMASKYFQEVKKECIRGDTRIVLDVDPENMM